MDSLHTPAILIPMSKSIATLSALADLVIDTGRDLDWGQLRSQIGAATVAAISGGRAIAIGASRIALPVSNGYNVIITLEADDTYTVERVRIHGGKLYRKGVRTEVYADEVSNVAYYASCYRSFSASEWVVK